MQFQVHQFLEVEDKLFVFLTFRQFLYLAGGFGGAYLAYAYLKFWLFILAALIIVPLSLAFAFWKINNKPFVYIVEAFLKYISAARLYIWKKVPKKIGKKADIERESPSLSFVPRLSENKLKDLAWTLDIKSRDAETMNIKHK